jgi:hypothetical protein
MKLFEIEYYGVNEEGRVVLMSKYDRGNSFEEMKDKYPDAEAVNEVIKIIPTTILGDGYNLN